LAKQRNTIGLSIAFALCAGTLAAQSPAVPPRLDRTAAGAERPSFSVGWEVHRDRYHYRFENPSSFDTSYLVPHFYQQDYDADNAWLRLRGRYRVFGRVWETSLALAPGGTGRGEDYDTFNQLDGDVVVYGTTAVTDLHAVQISQSADLGRALGLQWRGGYVYRRDRAWFRPSDSTTTHTSPPSVDSAFNAGRETTFSDLHDVQIGASRTASSPRLELTIGLDLSPITLAKLTTKLPDKYPDHDLVATARAFSLTPHARVTTRVGHVAAGFSLDVVRSWAYSRSARYSRDGFSAGIFVGLGPGTWSGLR
jgi:hypothetical protein